MSDAKDATVPPHKVDEAMRRLKTAREHLRDHKPVKAYDSVTSALQALEEARSEVNRDE